MLMLLLAVTSPLMFPATIDDWIVLLAAREFTAPGHAADELLVVIVLDRISKVPPKLYMAPPRKLATFPEIVELTISLNCVLVQIPPPFKFAEFPFTVLSLIVSSPY